MKRGEIFYAGFPSLEACVEAGLINAGAVNECEDTDAFLDEQVVRGRLEEVGSSAVFGATLIKFRALRSVRPLSGVRQ